MRTLLTLFLLILATLPLSGCGSDDSSDEDLGEIVTDISEVPGANKPYPLPDLGINTPNEDESKSPDENDPNTPNEDEPSTHAQDDGHDHAR